MSFLKMVYDGIGYPNVHSCFWHFQCIINFPSYSVFFLFWLKIKKIAANAGNEKKKKLFKYEVVLGFVKIIYTDWCNSFFFFFFK